MKKGNRGFTLAFFTALLIFIFTLGVCASAGDFETAAQDITGEGNYLERMTILLKAEGAYEALDDAERAEVSESYSRVLAEREALDALAARAQLFLSKVASLMDTAGIMDKVRLLEEAKAPEIYFDDESYPGIKEALLELERIQLIKDSTVSFMLTVDELVTERDMTATVADNYTVLKEILLRAEALYGFVDSGYSGAVGAINSYSTIRAEVQKAEKHTEGISELIELIDSKKDYRSKKNLIANLERAIESEDFVPDMECAREAEEALLRLKSYFTECEGLAQEYIIAVDAIGVAENRFSAIVAAMALRLQVDGTVNGVSASDGKLEAIREEYNGYASLINSVLLGIPNE